MLFTLQAIFFSKEMCQSNTKLKFQTWWISTLILRRKSYFLISLRWQPLWWLLNKKNILKTCSQCSLEWQNYESTQMGKVNPLIFQNRWHHVLNPLLGARLSLINYGYKLSANTKKVKQFRRAIISFVANIIWYVHF